MKNWKVWLAVLVVAFIGAMIKDRNTTNGIKKVSESMARVCISSLKTNPAIPEDKYQSICDCTSKKAFASIGADGFARLSTVKDATAADKEAFQNSAIQCVSENLPANK
jgi:hypothetical protein